MELKIRKADGSHRIPEPVLPSEKDEQRLGNKADKPDL